MARRFVPNRRFSRRTARPQYGWVTTFVNNQTVPLQTAAIGIALLSSADWRSNPTLNDKALLVGIQVDLGFSYTVSLATDGNRSYFHNVQHILLNMDNDEPNTLDFTDSGTYRDEDVLHLGTSVVSVGASVAGGVLQPMTAIWRPKLQFRTKTKRKLYADTDIRLFLGRFGSAYVGSDSLQANGYIRCLVQTNP